MTRENFSSVMKEIFRHEGGKSMHRKDPGNWTGGKVGVGELRGTNMGIAAHAHPTVDIMNLTVTQAERIYHKQYWAPIQGDNLPVGIDLVTMDPAVNSGTSRGVKWLQQALGVTPDGKMGAQTLAAARKADSLAVIRKACRVRLGWLGGLKTWTTFGRGWSRRVAEVEVAAVKMASAGNPIAMEQGRTLATQKVKQSDTVATGTAGSTTALTFSLPDYSIWLVAATVVALVLVIGLRRHHAARVAAYTKEL